MSEIGFIDTILETEGVAGEMVFNAKAALKDKVDKARAQADEIRVKARSQAAERHRIAIGSAADEAKVISDSIISEANKEAQKLKNDTMPRLKQASDKTAEGIVSIFGDR